MADLNDIYSSRLLELASKIPHADRLRQADAAASAHSKLCGSMVSVEIAAEQDRIINFGQTVKACLLGQASAAIVGQNIIGVSFEEFRSVAKQMREMLKNEGTPPNGRWADLALLAPVRPYKARHASTLLVFDAVEKALEDLK